MQKVLDLLNAIHPLSTDLSLHISYILKAKTFLKREFLLRDQNVCRHIWFLESGLVGCFYEKSDKTLCAWFMKEHDVVISVASFFMQKQSYESIVALDNTLTHYITFEELEWIYRHYPEFNYHGRVLVQQYYVRAEERMRAFHNQTPEEKYRYVMEHFPELIMRVSNRYLASFIGVREETLSRVKERWHPTNPTGKR